MFYFFFSPFRFGGCRPFRHGPQSVLSSSSASLARARPSALTGGRGREEMSSRVFLANGRPRLAATKSYRRHRVASYARYQNKVWSQRVSAFLLYLTNFNLFTSGEADRFSIGKLCSSVKSSKRVHIIQAICTWICR